MLRRVVIALLVLVTACGSEDATENIETTIPTTITVPLSNGPPRMGEDHWHAAYGVWVCDHFIEPLRDINGDAVGIHTHNDGLIHIHPTTPEAAGSGATFERFGDEVGIELGDGSFTLPTGETFANGDDCGGEPGVVQLIEWPVDTNGDVPVAIADGLGTVRLDADGDKFTLAFMAPDTALDALRPPSSGTMPTDVPDTFIPVGELPTTSLQPLEVPEGSEVQFRPVLEVFPAGLPTPPGASSLSDAVSGRDGSPYVLGPALSPGLIESATANLDPIIEQWVVLPLFRYGSPGIDDLNAIATTCFQRLAECPTSQLAIVVDDVVISTPAIQQASFERDAIQIAGDLSESEAKAIAEAFG